MHLEAMVALTKTRKLSTVTVKSLIAAARSPSKAMRPAFATRIIKSKDAIQNNEKQNRIPSKPARNQKMD
jgi:DNA-binding transcriptional regulator YiaG